MIRFLLKLWPALIPIIAYILWVKLFRPYINRNLNKSRKIIDAEYTEIREEKNSDQVTKNLSSKDFSLNNPFFIAVIYLSLIMIILTFLFFALYPSR